MPSKTKPADPEILNFPTGFTQGFLKMSLYAWQEMVLAWFDGHSRQVKGAVCTPNGAGKSERLVATLALWWLWAHPRGKVVITTRDGKQLDNQVYPAIRKHRGKFKRWKFNQRCLETPTGGRCVLFTTDEPGRAEGWHKEDNAKGPLLIIVDEAKSVPEEIFQAIDRCTYNALLYVSSPGVRSGRFYDVFTRDLGFKTLKAGLIDCPHIPRERIDDIARIYGADHPFTRSTLHGEFMDEDGADMCVVSPAALRALMETPPQFADGRQHAFCDFAAGGDENVLAHRVGNRILPLVAWKDANTMAAVGRFIIEFQKRGLRPGDIYGDAGGLGGPMIDRLSEAGWPINRVNNGAEALDPSRYENRGAEMWHSAAQAVAAGGVILPEDERLTAQLITRRLKPLSDGRLGVESKRDMAARGLTSPDRADAVVGVLAIDSEIAAGEFDPAGIVRLEAMTKPGKRGLIAAADFGVSWKEEPDGWLEVWETPLYGRAYLVSLKADQEGWSVFVLRKACTEDNGKLLHDACVGRLHPGVSHPWDAALLVDRLDILLRWYGNAVIVPDARNGTDIIDRLLDKGACIHRQPASPWRDAAPGALGWETTSKNVGLPLASLARAVREQTLDVWCATAVRDLRRYTRRAGLDNGDTLALAIGLHCLDAATVFIAPRFTPFAAPAISINRAFL